MPTLSDEAAYFRTKAEWARRRAATCRSFASRERTLGEHATAGMFETQAAAMERRADRYEELARNAQS